MVFNTSEVWVFEIRGVSVSISVAPPITSMAVFTAPTSSLTSTRRTSRACKVTFCRVKVRKPAASAVTEYVPSLSWASVKIPASFDLVAVLMPVNLLVAVSETFGTTAPVASVTVPVMVAKMVWLWAARAITKSSAQNTPHFRRKSDMLASVKKRDYTTKGVQTSPTKRVIKSGETVKDCISNR